MSLSIFELFRIGIGPSSSHTVGPMRAARRFVAGLAERGSLASCQSVRIELFGSLGLTGKGHGSDKAVLLGLQGERPESVDVDQIDGRLQSIRESRCLSLQGGHDIRFDERRDLLFHRRQTLPGHANGMRFRAFDAQGDELDSKIYYSVGGGFLADEAGVKSNQLAPQPAQLAFPFTSGGELLEQCRSSGLSISTLILQNERFWRSEQEIHLRLGEIWEVMSACIDRGCSREGILPGGMKIKRRAAHLLRMLRSDSQSGQSPMGAMDWVDLYALAVNEENAAGGRVVTAPTNGAAGIIPAVIKYYLQFCNGADSDGVARFLLTAGAIGILFKVNASISGAEVGCQGEVGSACSMAAAGLTEVLGGTPEQVENAAEIGMEHNLGLTCDPVGGLVQVPCIERNAMAAVKAINASRMALRGDGSHFVSLDKVIKTMRDTGRDMKSKYKETARGGLAVNVVEC